MRVVRTFQLSKIESAYHGVVFIIFCKHTDILIAKIKGKFKWVCNFMLLVMTVFQKMLLISKLAINTLNDQSIPLVVSSLETWEVFPRPVGVVPFGQRFCFTLL